MRQYLSLFAPAIIKQLKMPRTGHGLAGCDSFFAKNSALQQIAKTGSDFVSLHRHTGEVGDCSFLSENFHGLQAQDLLGAGFMQRVHVADRPACLAAFSAAFHGGETQTVELRLAGRSQESSHDIFCWIEMICSALESDEKSLGEHVGEQQVLCVARDITRFKQREQELLELQQSVQEKLEARTRFMANMSHELRTPLNAIIGFSEMMKCPGIVTQNEQQIAEYAAIIHDSGQDLLGVVDEVSDMSELAAGKYRLNPEIFRVADLVAASVEAVQITQFENDQKNLQIIVADFDADLQMSADLRACKRSLVLVLNAVANTIPASGRVHLAVTAQAASVEFVAIGSMPASDMERGRLRIDAQLAGLVDLLQANIQVAANTKGQESVVLTLPFALETRATISTIGSLDDMGFYSSGALQKTA